MAGRPGHPWQMKGRGGWYAKIKGRVTHLADTYDEAVAELARLKAELKAELCEVRKAVGMGTRTRAGTVAELVPAYLRAADVLGPTKGDYSSRLRWLAGHFGGVAVADLDPDEVAASARAEPWAANTRRQTLTVCQQFARWCGRAEFRVRMPAMESRGDEAVVTRDEYTALLAVARGDFRPLLRFLWLVGARPGEACKLTVELVDWTGGTATLKQHKTARKGKRRTLFLGGEALAVLAVQRAKYGSGPLFRGRLGAAFTADNVTERFSRAVEAAGLRASLTAYAIRHSYITRMLESGVPDSDVAVLVGHSGTAVIHRVYSHLGANAKRLRDVAARLDGAA